MTKLHNQHGEPCDCSGYRELSFTNRMTRRAKDEVLRDLEAKITQINDTLWNDEGRKVLTPAEIALLTYQHGLDEGRDRGFKAAMFEMDFRKRHNLKDEDPLPSPKEILKMDVQWNINTHRHKK